MQERAEISAPPEVFLLLLQFLVKESLRCMICLHPDCCPSIKPTAHTIPSCLCSHDAVGDQEVNKRSC
uniref:Uncharacterized protein n=1 Tax=Moschus moschiferus TaxID=68415 RepID=A0A8C6D649_MOSMO